MDTCGSSGTDSCGPTNTKAFKYIVIPIISIIAVGILATVVYIGRKCRRKRNPSKITDEERVDSSDRARLEKELADRRREEERSEVGMQQVWFSRRVEHGNLKHWVIGAGATQYELRKDAHILEAAADEATPHVSDGTGKYRYQRRPWTMDMERREANRTNRLIPKTRPLPSDRPNQGSLEDRYYVCLIGWTRNSEEEINEIAESIMRDFGPYIWAFNDCQTFALKLANKIVVETALDWNWFEKNQKTGYQESVHLEPPEAIQALNGNVMLVTAKGTKKALRTGPLDAVWGTVGPIVHVVGAIS
jgi:hypothetical protein